MTQPPKGITSLGLLVWLAACGGGDDDFSAPTCSAGEMRLEGDVDGHFESGQNGPTSYAFINALGDNLGTLVIEFPSGDTLSLEWPDLVANGASVDARGAVDLSATSGLHVGNCADDGFPGTLRMDEEGGGGAFQLNDLREGPSPYCDGAAVSGSITGCFKSPN